MRNRDRDTEKKRDAELKRAAKDEDENHLWPVVDLSEQEIMENMQAGHSLLLLLLCVCSLFHPSYLSVLIIICMYIYAWTYLRDNN